MKVFAVNTRNDLFVGDDGNIATATELDAVMQAAQQAAQTQLGEMVYATDEGVPNFAAVWNGAANLAQFDAYLRRVILAVDHVLDITELITDAANNVLTYSATIRTSYGTGTISNG